METSLVLLGDDGRGFDLARTLERSGVWRSWLGDSLYAAFIPYLSSPSTWENFMSSSSPTGANLSSSRFHIHLQLRVRALLYDKASVTLFPRPDDAAAPSSSLASINPRYLQLHGDDVYFSLEDMAPPDASAVATVNHHQSKARTSRQMLGIKRKHDELPDLWYDWFFDMQKKHFSHKFPFGNVDSSKRTPEGMSLYLNHLHTHKRSRQTFIGTQDSVPNNLSRGHSDVPKVENFIPEIMFPSNCVPDSAIPLQSVQVLEKVNKNVEILGVLDSLPQLITPSPAMIERFGIRPEYLKVEFGRSKYRGKDRSESSGETLSEKQALLISQKVVARTLENAGLDSGADVLFDVLPRFLGNHISKLGCMLKLLSDSYIKQHSSTEILRMFLKSTGFSSVAILSDYIKTSNRKVSHQNQLQAQPFQSQHQRQILQNQHQMLMQSQMKTFNPQNLSYQQQQILQQHLRRQQLSAVARKASIVENDRSLLEVMTENMSDAQIEGNTNIMNRQVQFRRQQQQQRQQHQQQQQQQQQQQKQQQQQQMVAIAIATNQTQNSHKFKQFSNVHSPQLQQQQQQMAAISNANQTQNSHQFKQFSTVHSPQLQTQVSFNRSQPVKVEGFQELMGGGRDSTSKHD